MEIRKVTSKECQELILNFHYAKRCPQIKYSWGIFENDVIVGCVTFGKPATPQVAKSVFPQNPSLVWELNRLVVNTQEKNAASKLIGTALREFTQPSIIVSYADGAVGHVGYVYQATNFFFCGNVKAHDSEYIWNGKKYHPRVLAHMGINNPVEWSKKVGAEKLPIVAKNRYVFICANRREKRDIIKDIKWPMSFTYPKGDTHRHIFEAPVLNTMPQAFLF